MIPSENLLYFHELLYVCFSAQRRARGHRGHGLKMSHEEFLMFSSLTILLQKPHILSDSRDIKSAVLMKKELDLI